MINTIKLAINEVFGSKGVAKIDVIIETIGEVHAKIKKHRP